MDKEDKKLLLGYIDEVGVIEKYLESLRVAFLVQIYDNEDKPLSENSKEEVYSIYSCYQEKITKPIIEDFQKLYDGLENKINKIAKECKIYQLKAKFNDILNQGSTKAIYEFIGEVVIESKNTIWKERCEEVNKWERENILKMIKKEIYYGFNRERWRQAEFYKF
ncbi:hypothetical protein RhiirC2_773297 [Rhizophagus irregularis]|uniref:Uncharacterized protein n=1 Tax=Rhizophagus irregularis TaxID=588596 RepID=A0A2N1NPI4_9GLOM|nr:hypothetical protein RhiirC2_773297 [Rhizophagus irregularis]